MITVVSGLPRSGTSLMMQLLGAGGIPLLTDAMRPSDADNERGYFEFEPVKSLGRDASWIAAAEGKAVKIVSLLLYHLPPQHDYRVVFMRRPLSAILRSQATMLQRRGEPAPQAKDDEALAIHLQRHLDAVDTWMARHPTLNVLPVEYEELLRNPLDALSGLPEFLNRDFDLHRMAQAIDPTLRHH
jgi:hypothetical protein